MNENDGDTGFCAVPRQLFFKLAGQSFWMMPELAAVLAHEAIAYKPLDCVRLKRIVGYLQRIRERARRECGWAG